MVFRAGVRIGVDVGKARIGVSRCDPQGILATPIATVARGDNDFGSIESLVAEHGAIEIVVGLPLSLSGARTASTDDAVEFGTRLASLVSVPVRLVDERLSTVSAQHALHTAGRTSKSSRAVIDQVAAVIILQHALDLERSTGGAPGELIHPDEGRTEEPHPDGGRPE